METTLYLTLTPVEVKAILACLRAARRSPEHFTQEELDDLARLEIRIRDVKGGL